ncbi:MAG: hypothetical protein HQL32_17745 [Planctomycetes bacterium]|nr:hypothetical protein [Planctomycetota bacterium]
MKGFASSLLIISLFITLFSAFHLIGGGRKAAQAKAFETQAKLILGSEYPDRVLSLMSQAKKRIYLCMYVASYQKERSYALENRLLKALATSYKKGVDVRVVLDASLEWDPKAGRMSGPRSKKNDKAYGYLKSQGVPVRYDSLEQTMHAKSLVIDEDLVVMGSTNWTYSALKKNVDSYSQ